MHFPPGWPRMPEGVKNESLRTVGDQYGKTMKEQNRVADYTSLLEHSFDKQNEFLGATSRLAYVSDYIFDFTTYDSELSELLARRALEVCEAIDKRETFKYIGSPGNYLWFIVVVNMPFFADRLEWGTSIRGAWWANEPQELESSGLYSGDRQIPVMNFSVEDWRLFIRALINFCAAEVGRENPALIKDLSENTHIVETTPPFTGQAQEAPNADPRH